MAKKKKRTQEKSRITDIEAKEEMFKLFDMGESGKTNIWKLLKTRFAIQNSRAYKLYDLYHPEWSEIKNKVMTGTITKEQEERLKKEIESRYERIADLQNKKELLNEQLIKGKVKEYYIKEGEPKAYERDMRPAEIASLVRSHKMVSAEISRLENDYPANKLDHQPIEGEIDEVPEQFITLDSGIQINIS